MSELEDLRRLRYFVAVAEESSFTRAAARLRVSQPAVSEAIRQLERALGVTLFVRDDRPIALTAAGSALLEDSRSLLAAAERVVARARRVGAGLEGDVVIASTQSLSAGFIPALLGRLGRRVPPARARHRLGWTSDVVESVRGGAATVGFVRYAPAVDGLSQVTLDHEPVMACLGPDHRLAGEAAVGLRDLAGDRWAIMDRSMAPRWYEVFMASCEAAGVKPDIAEFVTAADVTAAQATFGRVAAGELVTYVGASMIPVIARFGIRFVQLDASLPPLPVDALWREDERLADRVLEAAREVCATNWWGPADPTGSAESGSSAPA